jgi:hypothetical protein
MVRGRCRQYVVNKSQKGAKNLEVHLPGKGKVKPTTPRATPRITANTSPQEQDVGTKRPDTARIMEGVKDRHGLERLILSFGKPLQCTSLLHLFNTSRAIQDGTKSYTR